MTVVVVDEANVKVFDSMFRSVVTCVSMQAASLLHPRGKQIIFYIETAQIQNGGADCGLFVIAFATSFVSATIRSTRGKSVYFMIYDD